MKPKHLESRLQQLRGFDRPRLELEQYATPPELAVAILDQVQRDGVSLGESVVADLGCGCGTLLLGAALLGAPLCVGVELDPKALEICRTNVAEVFGNENEGGSSSPVELVLGDATAPIFHGDPPSNNHQLFDLVLTNPPFGTKAGTEGADWRFVLAGLRALRPGGRLYSLHKTASRRVLQAKVRTTFLADELVREAKCVAELRWPLVRTYAHQRHHSKDIAVDLFCFVRK